MEYKKIGDIIELHRGYDLPIEQMEKGNVPVVGSNGIVGYHNHERSISPTVTIGRSGSIGKVHFYDGFTWVHNTALYVNDFKGNDPLYIYYILKNLDFENLKSSSVVPSLNRNYVYPMKVPFCERTTDQEKISKTLRSIDKKITLNTRMNAELEAMAKQLYDYWFVQFDFPFDFAQGKPDENGKPYKSSGGKMVWNEKLKREIPEGWEVKDLDFFANTPKESITPYNYPEKTFKHYSIPAYDECGTYLQEPGSSIQSDKFIVKEGQILVPKLNPWYNRVLYVNKSDDSICSTEFVIFDVYEEYTKGYLYFVVKSESFINYCTKSSTGTSHSQRRVNPDILKEFCVPYNKKIVKLYSSKVMPCILKMYKNTDLNKSTIKLRDSLLPMLMNGQVTIE